MMYRAVLDADSRWPRWSVEREDGAEVAYATVEASAQLAAERLSAGRPVGSPREATESTLRLYRYPSRFEMLRDRYLTLGGAQGWINGGLWEDDVTAVTEEGAAAIESRLAEEDRERASDEDAVEVRDLLTRCGMWVEPPPRGRDLALYRAGRWPEVGDDREELVIDEIYDGCALGHLLRANTSRVDPEWLEDARSACRLLLKHGDDARGGVSALRSWAGRLAVKHGGRWAP